MSNADDALAAAAEAEAEAAEAEALAAAARARARAIRLRREAEAAQESAAIEDPPPTTPPTTPPPPTVPPDETVSPAVESDEASVVAEASPAGAPRRAFLVKVVAAAVVVVCSLALLGLAAAMYLRHGVQESQRRESAEFAAGARQGVVTLMSLDFNKAKEDAQRIIDNTTGDFKKDFERQAKEFVQVAQESKVVTEANVTAVAVQSMTKDTATVLVAVATNVSNKASSQQAPRSWRLSVDVARDGDQIKLSKVEFVQ